MTHSIIRWIGFAVIRWAVVIFLVIPRALFDTTKLLLHTVRIHGTSLLWPDKAPQPLSNVSQQRIVVTGGRSTYTLDLIRMLSKAGHIIHSVETKFMYPFPLSRFSRHVHRHDFIDVFPNENPRLYAKKLGQYCAKHSISLIVPTCEDVMWVSKYKSVIRDEYMKNRCSTARESTEKKNNNDNDNNNELVIFVSDFDLMKQVHDKYSFNQLISRMAELENDKEKASALSWSVPQSAILRTRGDLREYLNRLNKTETQYQERLNIVLKPVFSRFAVDIMIRPTYDAICRSFGIIDASSSATDDEIELKGGPWVGQQYIDGQLLCSYSIVHSGQIVAHAVYFGGQYTNSGRVDGGSVYFENANDSSDVHQFVQQFVSWKNYTGQISFDFIRCHDTGQLFPIECNPRSTSGIHLFRSVDPSQFASCFVNSNRNDQTVQRILSPVGENQQIAAAMVLLLTFIMPIDSIRDITRWISKYRVAGDIMYDVTDPAPAVTQFLSILDPVYKVVKYRIAFTNAFTHDIEYNADNADK